MPVDEDGNSADMVMDSASIISRMNIGRLYEHYIGAAIRDVAKRVKLQLGVNEKVNQARVKALDPQAFEKAYNYLLHFYSLVCDKQFAFFSTGITVEERYEHMADVLNDGIYLYYPINNQKSSIQVIKDIERDFKPTYGPVSYVGDSGKRVTTKSKVRIAPLYIMLLDKIADDWSAVSSGKLQHFGVLSPMTKSEKFSYPYRNSPVRTIGETEGRIFAGYCGREAIAEMIDRSNSPYTQRNMYWNILTAPVPSNIDYVVDRSYVKLGASRPLGLMRHMFGIAGFALVYESEAPRTPYHDNRVAVQPTMEP